MLGKIGFFFWAVPKEKRKVPPALFWAPTGLEKEPVTQFGEPGGNQALPLGCPLLVLHP